MFRLGLAVGWTGSLFVNLQSTSNCYTTQFPLGSTVRSENVTLTSTDISLSKSLLTEYPSRNFYIHAPYNWNLAGSKSGFHAKLLTQELIQLEPLRGSYILHIGKSSDASWYQTVADKINKMPAQKLVLENAAGQGTEVGKNWEEIRHLFEALDKPDCGLCIDTQHTFAAGMCDFSNHESVVKLFEKAEECCGKRRLRAFHLNDSAKTFGARVDRHANIGQGYIWSANQESLKTLIRLSYENQIDLILETPNPAQDYVYLMQMVYSK